MFKLRFFNSLIIAALIVMAAFTIQQARETSRVVHAADSEGSSVCAVPVVNRTSVHSEYAEEAGVWLAYSDKGPTGVDGGLLEILSNYRRCSE